MFTSSTEWMVAGGSNEDYLTPTNPIARPQTRRGSYFLPPFWLATLSCMYRPQAVSFVTSHIRSKTTRSTDLTEQFWRDTCLNTARLCRGATPNRLILSSGQCWTMARYCRLRTCANMTYGAGRRTKPAGRWKVLFLPEGDEDAVYITVKRTIDGEDYRFHERMASRRVTGMDDWFFVDCGLRLPVTTITGLHHLNGMAVSVLADGYELEGLTVQNGELNLGRNAFSNVVVGLKYEAEVETLDLDLGNIPELGIIAGREMSLPQLLLHVEHTRGIWTGHDHNKRTSETARRRKLRRSNRAFHG